jgi:hypothetical protein
MSSILEEPQWEQCKFYWDNDFGYYSKTSKNTFINPYDFDLYKINTKKDADSFINRYIDDTNILYFAMKYFNIDNKKIATVNKTNKAMEKPLISRQKNPIKAMVGGADHIVDQNIYINGMMQLLDTWHDFGYEAMVELKHDTGMLLPNIFKPNNKIWDYSVYNSYNKTYGKAIAIPDYEKGFPSFVLDVLSKYETLTFNLPNNIIEIVDNPLYRINFKTFQHSWENNINTLPFTKLYEKYNDVRAGLLGEHTGFATRDVWLYKTDELYETVSKEQKVKHFVMIDMLNLLCADILSCYNNCISNNNELHLQLDNWSILGEYLLVIPLVNDALYNKFTNSKIVIDTISSLLKPHIKIRIFYNDAAGFDMTYLNSRLELDPLPTGNVYPDGLDYQVTLNGYSLPDRKLEKTIDSYIYKRKMELKQNPDKELSDYEKILEHILVDFSVTENGKQLPFTKGIIPLDCSKLFSTNNIESQSSNYYKAIEEGTYNTIAKRLEKPKASIEDYYSDKKKGYNVQNNIIEVLRPGTRYALKRAGDWGQVESCFGPDSKPRKVFVTSDKIAAAYAVSRGIPIMYNADKVTLQVREHKNSDKEILMAISFIMSKKVPKVDINL